MQNGNFQKEIIPEIEKQIKGKVEDIRIPPQGMDSEVFFVTDSKGMEYAVKGGKNAASDVIAYGLLGENKIDIPVPTLFGNFVFFAFIFSATSIYL